MHLPSEAPEVVAVPCVVCGSPSDGEVWGRRTCNDCWVKWMDEAPNAGEAKTLATPAQLAESAARKGLLCAFYEAWTAAWIAKNKARAA